MFASIVRSAYHPRACRPSPSDVPAGCSPVQFFGSRPCRSMTLSTRFKCSPIRVSPASRSSSSATRARHSVRQERGGLVLHALVSLLRSEDRLAIGEGNVHASRNRVRFFGDQVGQGDSMRCQSDFPAPATLV